MLGGYKVDEGHGVLEGSDMNNVTGIPDLAMYKVQVYTDGKLLKTYGKGTREVRLKFWTDQQFFQMFQGLKKLN